MTGDTEQLRLILTLAAWFGVLVVVVVVFCYVFLSEKKRL